MSLDKPPQTVAESMEFGWTAMEFECNRQRCKHIGRIDLRQFNIERWNVPLAAIFWRAVCGKCGTRPTYARLAYEISPGTWRTKRVEINGMEIRRASRE